MTFTRVLLFLSLIQAYFTLRVYGQLMKCQYGERGSLTATCTNASSTFFRATTYRFDSLDETVVCVNCNLDVIESNTFDLSGNQILTLDLHDSKINVLKDSSFVGLVFLKNLFLQNNKIRNIVPNVFKGIRKVDNLQLSNNSLTYLIPEGFKELKNLTTLNLEHNSIKGMEKDSFVGLISLKYLNLAHNELTEIKGWFDVLQQVLTIDLHNNKIEHIHNDDFLNITNLLSLNLANNQITTIDLYAFTTLHKLESLDLSGNHLRILDRVAFRGLRSLETLDLSNNMIGLVARSSFMELSELRDLSLAKNQLHVFNTRTFTALPEMRYLNLSYNNISQVNRNGLMALHSLHTLDLSHNGLIDLDYKSLHHHMPKITYLGLNANKWPCYLITEMDDYFFTEGNVKLTADGMLTNTPCANVSKKEVAIIAEELYAEENHLASYAHSYVVYPFMAVLVLLNVAMFYLIYRMDRNAKYFGGANKSTSHVNLVSSDLHARDNEY